MRCPGGVSVTFSLHFKGSFLQRDPRAKMSLFYCLIRFINSSVYKSCRKSPIPLNRRMQSTYPWQYAFCPSSELISSSFAIHSKSNCRCSCGSCYITASHFSRILSISSRVSLYPGTFTAVSLVTSSQRSRFKNCPAGSHILFCISMPSFKSYYNY